MAQVARSTDLARFVSTDLENVLGFWQDVPEMVEEWPEWDDVSRSDLILQYPILREVRTRIMAAADAGLLDAEQRSKYDDLLRLIEEHRATVEWMLEGPI